MEQSLQETDEALTTQQKRLSELEHAISEGAETEQLFAKAAAARRLLETQAALLPEKQAETARLRKQRDALDFVFPLEQAWKTAEKTRVNWQRGAIENAEKEKQAEEILAGLQAEKLLLDAEKPQLEEKRSLLRRLKADEERVWQREKTKQETERLAAEKSAAEAEIQALQEMLTAQEKAQQEWQVMLFMQEKLLLEKKAQEQTIARKREFIEGIEGTVVDVVMQSVKKILGEMNREDRIRAIVKTALANVRGQQKVTVRVAPSDEPVVSEALAAQTAGSFLTVVADARLEPDSCILESDLGVINASLSTQLKALEHAFSAKIRQ